MRAGRAVRVLRMYYGYTYKMFFDRVLNESYQNNAGRIQMWEKNSTDMNDEDVTKIADFFDLKIDDIIWIQYRMYKQDHGKPSKRISNIAQYIEDQEKYDGNLFKLYEDRFTGVW